MKRISSQDWLGLGVILLIGGGMAAFRQVAIVPRATVGLCAANNAPAAFCAPRQAVLWLQYQHAFGWVALALGLIGFCYGHRWAGILGIAVGIAAVVNYNATAGILGAAFGLVAWVGLNTGRYSVLR